MDPGQPRAAGLCRENPVPGFLHDLVGAPFSEAKRRAASARRVVVIVDVEAVRQAVSRVKDEGAHERAGPVSRRLQDRRQRRDVIAEAERGVVPNPVSERRSTGEYGCVGGQRHRCVREGTVEADAGRCQGIEGGCQTGATTVGAKPIAAKRVDGDEQDARPPQRA